MYFKQNYNRNGNKGEEEKRRNEMIKEIYLAGGCFWGTEKYIENIKIEADKNRKTLPMILEMVKKELSV